MCGIAGVLDKRRRLGPDGLASLAGRMADVIAHRGPDDSGVWVSADGRVALSHRRLSILDTSSAAHQPMSSHGGWSHIVFNGEIYNFSDLRSDLEREGVLFRSSGDTEVLLATLERYRQAAFGKLDAMFAFAWFDERSGELFLARDMFGEKPLYYADTPNFFAFASELSALTLVPDFDLRIDAETIAHYLAFQYVPAPDAIYRGARKLEPGSWLAVSVEGHVTTERYYAFAPRRRPARYRSLVEAGDALEEILASAVGSRLISDVPIGAFLSGGVDSATIVAFANKALDHPVRTFTVGFDGATESEHREAAEMAKHIGTEHHERLLMPDATSLCGTIASALDEPNGDTSCLPTYLLSAFARETVTVALSGDGGDELFGGYGRYLATVDEAARRSRAGMEWWTPGRAYWSSRILVFPEDELVALTGVVPHTLSSELTKLRRRLDEDDRPLIHRLREIDASHYMPGAVLAKVDRMSMQHGLEVRAPLLAPEIAAFAASLSDEECIVDGGGKAVLKEVARRHLPDAWLRRPKRGFGLPMGLWGAGVLLPAARRMFAAEDCRLAAFMPRERLIAYLDRMERQFGAYRVWSLLILELWLRAHPHVVGTTFSQVETGGAAVQLVESFRSFAARGRRLMARFR